MIEEFDIKAGDILIVKGKSNVSKLLSISQKFFYPANTSSHILISVSDGFYIHATSESGVHFISIKELLPQIEQNYKIIRFKNINDAQYEELSKKVMFYMGQVYNKSFFFEKAGASFCSELAAKIYKLSGISIFNGKSPHIIVPAHFEKEADLNQDWTDITTETKICYGKLLSMGHGYWVAEQSFHKIMRMMSLRIQMHNTIHEVFTSKNMVSENLSKTFVDMQKKLAPKLNVLNWDDIHTKYYLDKDDI